MPKPPAAFDCGLSMIAIDRSAKIVDVLVDMTNRERIDAVLLFLFAMASSACVDGGMSRKDFWDIVATRIREMDADTDLKVSHRIIVDGAKS